MLSPFIITHIASIGPLEQCCKLVWLLVIIYLTYKFTYTHLPLYKPPPPLIFVIKTL